MNKSIINIKKSKVTINITLYQLPDGSLCTDIKDVQEHKRKNKHNK